VLLPRRVLSPVSSGSYRIEQRGWAEQLLRSLDPPWCQQITWHFSVGQHLLLLMLGLELSLP
jgi:hypothetical protein